VGEQALEDGVQVKGLRQGQGGGLKAFRDAARITLCPLQLGHLGLGLGQLLRQLSCTRVLVFHLDPTNQSALTCRYDTTNRAPDQGVQRVRLL
jgi:hypothetical protein